MDLTFYRFHLVGEILKTFMGRPGQGRSSEKSKQWDRGAEGRARLGLLESASHDSTPAAFTSLLPCFLACTQGAAQ